MPVSYYINFTLLFAVIKHFKKELVFHYWPLNSIFHYHDVGAMTSFFFFISLGNFMGIYVINKLSPVK